jgi:hypothetical protein
MAAQSRSLWRRVVAPSYQDSCARFIRRASSLFLRMLRAACFLRFPGQTGQGLERWDQHEPGGDDHRRPNSLPAGPPRELDRRRVGLDPYLGFCWPQVCGTVQERIAAQSLCDVTGFADRGRGGLVIASALQVLGMVE